MSGAYQKAAGQYADPSTGADASGMQQAVWQSALGADSAVTPTLTNQAIGADAVVDGLEAWDGTTP